MKGEEIMLGLLRGSLWDAPQDLKGQAWSHEQYQAVMTLAKEQAVAGLVAQGLMDSGVRLERADALEVFGLIQQIRKRNAEMDAAVVELCQVTEQNQLRIFVFKGQSVGYLYPDHGLRQSGDIDFFCHHEDWTRAISLLQDQLGLKLNDLNSSKDVCFVWKGVTYEMHKRITSFCYPRHERYWREVVMPEILEHPYSINIDGHDIPTLAPTYNALFIFVHIFQHLIADGIALRQFCDWARVLHNNAQNVIIEESNNEKCNISYDIAVLERHLKGLELRKAYTGLGAMLTEYLGLTEEQFPFEISDQDRKRLPALWENMQERGNFGQKVKYRTKNMMAHGLEHLWRMSKQAREFYHYAPAEAWWHIPSMFPWWIEKIKRMARKS